MDSYGSQQIKLISNSFKPITVAEIKSAVIIKHIPFRM